MELLTNCGDPPSVPARGWWNCPAMGSENTTEKMISPQIVTFVTDVTGFFEAHLPRVLVGFSFRPIFPGPGVVACRWRPSKRYGIQICFQDFLGGFGGVCDTPWYPWEKQNINVRYKSFPVDCQYSTGFLHVKDSSLSLQGLQSSAQRLSRPALKCHSCETFYCTRSVGGGLVRGCLQDRESNVWISPTRISWNSRCFYRCVWMLRLKFGEMIQFHVEHNLGSNWVGWNHQLAEYHFGAVVIHQIKITTLQILEQQFGGGGNSDTTTSATSLPCMAFPIDHFQEKRPDVHLLAFFSPQPSIFAHGPARSVLAEAHAVAWNVKKLWEGALKRFQNHRTLRASPPQEIRDYNPED